MLSVDSPEYKAAAASFRKFNNGTTFTPTTESQNLAAIIKQPGNTAPMSAYKAGVLEQAAKESVPQGVTPPVTPPQTGGTSYQPPVSAQRATPDYAALAASRTAAALARKQTIAQQQKAAADTAYNQQNLRTQDNRRLQDFSRTQVANPFANMGRTSFNEGLIGRERTQQDADAAAALQTQKSNIDQLLADYQDATGEEQMRIADELQRAYRDYNLQLDQFNSQQQNQNFNQNLQTQQFNYNTDPNNPQNQGQLIQNQGNQISNQLAQLQLENFPAQAQQQAKILQQQVAAGQISNEAAQLNLDTLKDPNSPVNQAAKIDLQLKQLDLKNAPEQARLQLQQLQKQIAQIGAAPYRSENEIAMDKVKLDTAKEAYNQLVAAGKGEKPSDSTPLTAEAYSKYFDSGARYDSDQVLTNPDAVESSILLSGLPESEMRKAYARYGLKWGG